MHVSFYRFKIQPLTTAAVTYKRSRIDLGLHINLRFRIYLAAIISLEWVASGCNGAVAIKTNSSLRGSLPVNAQL